MPKRTLPVMPDLEVEDGLVMHRGGTHGYKKVKFSKQKGTYQGCNNELKLYTARFEKAKDAAKALAQLEKDYKEGLVKGKKLTLGAPKKTHDFVAACG